MEKRITKVVKTYDEIRETAIEQIIFEATDEMGDLRNEDKAYHGMLHGLQAIFGDEEYHIIIKEVKKRITERGLQIQKSKNS